MATKKKTTKGKKKPANAVKKKATKRPKKMLYTVEETQKRVSDNNR